MRIVLDTNVLLVSLPLSSTYRPIFEALKEGRFTLLITTDILIEYEEILAKKTRPDIAQNVVRMLINLHNVDFIDVWYRWNLISVDSDDNKFVDCAIASNAKYIVSDDRHFKVLDEISFPKVEVLTSNDFLELLRTK